MFHVRMKDWIRIEIGGTNIVTIDNRRCIGKVTPSSMRREQIQLISEVVVATNRYSAFVDDRATVRCFLDDQEIR